MGTASVVSWRVIPFPCSFGWLYNASASASALSFVPPNMLPPTDAVAAFIEASLAPLPESLAELVYHVDAAYDRTASANAVKAACDSIISTHLEAKRKILPRRVVEDLRAFCNLLYEGKYSLRCFRFLRFFCCCVVGLRTCFVVLW